VIKLAPIVGYVILFGTDASHTLIGAAN